jgi:hypothetical protein
MDPETSTSLFHSFSLSLSLPFILFLYSAEYLSSSLVPLILLP